MPFVLMALWLWASPFTDNDHLTLYQIMTLPLLIIFMPILFVLDIIVFPFHCVNVYYRQWSNLPYNGDYYWYEYMLRENPNNFLLYYEDNIV